MTCCIGLIKPVGFAVLLMLLLQLRKYYAAIFGYLQNCMFFPNGGGGEEARGFFVLKIHFHITSLSIHFSSTFFFFFFEVNEPVGINTSDISLSFPFLLSSHTPLTSISTYIPSSPSSPSHSQPLLATTLTGLGVLGLSYYL